MAMPEATIIRGVPEIKARYATSTLPRLRRVTIIALLLEPTLRPRPATFCWSHRLGDIALLSPVDAQELWNSAHGSAESGGARCHATSGRGKASAPYPH